MTKSRVLRTVATRGSVPKHLTIERSGITADELDEALNSYIDRCGIEIHDGDTQPLNIVKLAIAVHNLRVHERINANRT